MSSKRAGLAVALGILISSPLLAPGRMGSATARSDRYAPAHRAVAPHYRHVGGYRPPYGYTVHGQYVPGANDSLVYGPGYVFVPGRGILGEDCNMPTSTCTNEYRDVQ